MDDATAGNEMHRISLRCLDPIAQRVTVLDTALKQVRNDFKPSVWVVWETCMGVEEKLVEQ